MDALRYYYLPNITQFNSAIYHFAVWDGSTGSQQNRIVAFAVTEKSAQNITHQLNTNGHVED